MNSQTKLNKLYLSGVMALTIFLPLLCGFAEEVVSKRPLISWDEMGKWFIFWAVGLRLFTAGLRQAINPSFTAETIFHLQYKESQIIVRELGFANICFGLIGIVSLFIPQWRIVSAFGSGIFYGIAGVHHLLKKPAGSNEKIALVSDIFIFLCLLIYVIHAFMQTSGTS